MAFIGFGLSTLDGTNKTASGCTKKTKEIKERNNESRSKNKMRFCTIWFCLFSSSFSLSQPVILSQCHKKSVNLCEMENCT